ncbi:MAG: lamin tail domain-containing protein [Nannocystaceae bacterium]
MASPRTVSLAALALLGSAACTPTAPDFDAPQPQPQPDVGALPSPWDDLPDRVPSPPPTTGGSPGTTSGSTTGGATTTGGEDAVDLSGLRLTEVLANPEGKDGAGDSPELVEFMNTSPQATPLRGLTLLARGWPRLDADALGIDDHALPPGGLLVLRRYFAAEEAPWIGVAAEDELLEVHLVTADGLRNSDGAVLLVGPDDAPVDALIYGGPPPPSHDLDGAWIGPPVDPPVSGSSWCRADPEIDSDAAEDWTPCSPSPGELPAPWDTGGDTDTDTDTGSTTADPPVDATVVIVEVLSNAPGPSAKERELEYVELLNLGPDAVDLEGWTVADAAELDAPGRDPLLFREGDGGCEPALCLAPGRRALLVGNAYLGPVGDALVLETDDTTLADGGLTAHEPVVLRDADDDVASTYRLWDDPYAEPYPIELELPLHRETPEATDSATAWAFAESSPGLP